MRDGLPVVALIVSCVALLIALIGTISPAGSDSPESPEEMLQAALKKLEAIEKNRQTMRRQISELGEDIVEIKEASAGARGEAFDKVEVENIVRQVVETELGKRIKQEAAKVGAKVGGKPGAATAGAAKPGAKASPKQQAFDRMVQAIRKELKLNDAKTQSVKVVLTSLRTELNSIYGLASKKKIDVATRNKKAVEARQRADARLAKVLSGPEMGKLRNWRRTAADAYTKRFFGH